MQVVATVRSTIHRVSPYWWMRMRRPVEQGVLGLGLSLYGGWMFETGGWKRVVIGAVLWLAVGLVQAAHIFRRVLELDFPAEGLAIVGDNGQGKSRSKFRKSRDSLTRRPRSRRLALRAALHSDAEECACHDEQWDDNVAEQAQLHEHLRLHCSGNCGFQTRSSTSDQENL